jgi:glycerol-3-phosphate acyltransferase PlsX
MVLDGVARIHTRHPHARFRLFGDQGRLRPQVESRAELRAACEIVHTDDVITNDDKPSQALRKGRQSSMRLAIDAVAEGGADGVVSAGNTGALMAISKVVLRTLPGIARPAIASAFPTERGETVVLDLGANVECGAEHLVQFAVMGANFAHSVLGRKRPLVGLLNVGVEEMKGHESVKAAAEALRAATDLAFDFHGFVEGDDIAKGTVDVVVTDGFTGNVALKASEGAARLMTNFLRLSLRRSLMSRLGYLLARPALNSFRERLDPRFYNGGVFLGLNGVVVKSHGGTDAVGFAAALEIAIDLVRDRVIERIAADFQRFAASVTPDAQPATVTP